MLKVISSRFVTGRHASVENLSRVCASRAREKRINLGYNIYLARPVSEDISSGNILFPSLRTKTARAKTVKLQFASVLLAARRPGVFTPTSERVA